MNIKLDEINSYHGIINIPGSKSITHRAIICASLIKNNTIIENANICEDTIITMNLLKSIGVKYEVNDTTIKVIPPTNFNKPNSLIDAKNSGSSIRFLIPIFWTLFNNFKVQVDKRMAERLILTKTNGIDIKTYEENQKTIIEVTNLDIDLLINNNKTSQYTSGILMSSFIKKDFIYLVSKEINDNPYVKMTNEVIKYFNDVSNQKNSYFVEVDYSLASYFMVMAALNGEIYLNCNPFLSIQGDNLIIDYLKKMNVNITYQDTYTIIKKSTIKNANFDMRLTPDLIPTIASLMAVTDGTSVITGFEKLPFKETNRLEEIITILNYLGSNIKQENNKLIIKGTKVLNNPNYLKLPNDHRLIMMVLAISSCFKNPITIEGIEAVNKSYPNFIHDSLN